MTRNEIIQGLKFTIGMFLFDPCRGEELTEDMLNEDNRLTVESCKGAIELLEADGKGSD